MKPVRRTLLVIAALICIANLNVNLTAQPRGSFEHSITGRVLSRISKPVPNLWVLAYEGSRLKNRSLTGDDGSYFIARLEAKTYTIVVKRELRSTEDLFRSDVRVPLSGRFDIRLP
jgi:hypothetical protein